MGETVVVVRTGLVPKRKRKNIK